MLCSHIASKGSLPKYGIIREMGCCTVPTHFSRQRINMWSFTSSQRRKVEVILQGVTSESCFIQARSQDFTLGRRGHRSCEGALFFSKKLTIFFSRHPQNLSCPKNPLSRRLVDHGPLWSYFPTKRVFFVKKSTQLTTGGPCPLTFPGYAPVYVEHLFACLTLFRSLRCYFFSVSVELSSWARMC